MTYRINGQRVTKEEFLEGADGISRIIATNQSPVAGSFEPFVSILDGKMIRNRKELSEHNRRYGVEQVGHEYERNRGAYNKEVAKEEALANKQADLDRKYLSDPAIKRDVKQFVEGIR